MADKATLNSTLFQIDSFRGGFQVSNFLDKLAGLVLDEADLKKRLTGKSNNVQRPQTAVQESLGLVQQLLQQFQRWDHILSTCPDQSRYGGVLVINSAGWDLPFEAIFIVIHLSFCFANE